MNVHLFDEVLLQDGASGIVKFIGEVRGKEGIFYGVDIKKGEGKNNGCIKNRRYFRTKKDANSGRFTTLSKIEKTSKTSKSVVFTIGDKIKCLSLGTTGIIRYVGIPEFDKTAKTVHFGLELKDAKGAHDGTLYSSYLSKKISYFKCDPNHGVYIKMKEVKVHYVGHGDAQNDEDEMQNDTKTDFDGKDMEIARLRRQITNLQESQEITEDRTSKLEMYYQDEYEKLLKEYSSYKQEARQNSTALPSAAGTVSDEKYQELVQQFSEYKEESHNALQKVIESEQERYALLKQAYDDMAAKQKQSESVESERASKLEAIYQKEYEKLMKEFAEYKLEHEEKDNVPANIQEELEKLKQEHGELREKYEKATEKIRSLTEKKKNKEESKENESSQSLHSTSTPSNNMYSTEYLEKELEELRSKQKTKKSKKQRISGMLTKFAANDINSASMILKEMLKQWDSQFISTNSRVDLLKNCVDILKVIGNTMDSSTKNEDLDASIKKLMEIIRSSRDSQDSAIASVASELYDEDIVLQFMMQY
eukprot:CAMPEP_0197031066 /NCGR_PEP_ID=MMETSP1384-20130603/10173_1 /TAXON_ID=29189 /ORGANISM="Ammonia sp." /LENGTH=534 /DNA_ID=CAMNT_0042460543 /DNA_START=147 /DNA_END=1751 /DNA_ORIENTATION=+